MTEKITDLGDKPEVQRIKEFLRKHQDELFALGLLTGAYLVGRRGGKKVVLKRFQEQYSEVQRQALGYGFEIGRGAELLEQVNVSSDNPFINKNWRDMVIKGVEQTTLSL